MSKPRPPKWLSRPAVLWVMDDAPGVPAHLVSTLTAYARYADDEGRGSYPLVATVARLTRKTRIQAVRNTAELERLGLLLPGDPGLVKEIRADRRPNVYDLPMSRGVPGNTPPEAPRGDMGATPPEAPRGNPGATPSEAPRGNPGATPSGASRGSTQVVTGSRTGRDGVAPRAHRKDLKKPGTSSARPPAREAADIIRDVYPGATDDEIETIIKDRIAHGARSPRAVLAHEAEQATLRLPCDRGGPGRHSGACRDGDPGRCGMDWCVCRCHTGPARAEAGEYPF